MQSETLLLHEQNGDGAFLVRYSPRKKAFVLSIKFMNSETSDWTVTHYNVMRTDQANKKVTENWPCNLMTQLNVSGPVLL